MQIVSFAASPAFKSNEFRLLKGAQRLMPEVALGHASVKHPFQDPTKPITLHLAAATSGGGGKTQLKQIQQSALATALLDHGFSLSWTTATVDTLIARHQLSTLQQITNKPSGGARINAVLQLIQESGIEIPATEKAQSHQSQPGAPWNKTKRAKTDLKLPAPEDYVLVDGFFSNQDGSSSTILSALRPQASGICLMSETQAQAWIKDPHKLSSDELGVLIIGQPAVPSHHSPTHVVFPCRNREGNMVLMSGTLLQLGAKNVIAKRGEPDTITSQKCRLFAVTLHKQDFPVAEWSETTRNPQQVIRTILSQDSLQEYLHAMWGRSLRQGRAPANPQLLVPDPQTRIRKA